VSGTVVLVVSGTVVLVVSGTVVLVVSGTVVVVSGTVVVVSGTVVVVVVSGTVVVVTGTVVVVVVSGTVVVVVVESGTVVGGTTHASCVPDTEKSCSVGSPSSRLASTEIDHVCEALGDQGNDRLKCGLNVNDCDEPSIVTVTWLLLGAPS
jgi:hypothetical protein